MKNAELPKGIKASSLVDISRLNLREDATNRVSMKISEAVLSEYASLSKPSSLVVAGRISDIFKIPDFIWVGIIAPDLDVLREGGFSGLDKSLPELLKTQFEIT